MEESLWMMQAWIRPVDMKWLLFLRTDGCEARATGTSKAKRFFCFSCNNYSISVWLGSVCVFNLTPENLVIRERNAQMHFNRILISTERDKSVFDSCNAVFIVSFCHLMSNETSGSWNRRIDTGDQKQTSVLPAPGNLLSGFREQIWERFSHMH